MQILPFPGCCTAAVLAGFGGSSTAQYGDHYDERTEEQLFTEIGKHLDSCHRRGWAMVFATTTGQQEKANRVLPRIGFQKIDETAKANHNNYPLIGWVFRLNPEKEVAPLVVPKNPFTKTRPVDTPPTLPAAQVISDGPSLPFRPARIRFGVDILDDVNEITAARIRQRENLRVTRILTNWVPRLSGARVRVVEVAGLRGNFTEIWHEDVGRVIPMDLEDFGNTRLEFITNSGTHGISSVHIIRWEGMVGSPEAIRFYRATE